MKLLFVSHYDVFDYGVAEAMWGLASGLRRAGVEVAIYSSHPSARRDQPRGECEVVHGPMARPGHWPPRQRRATRHLARVCRDRGIDLVHAHGLYRPGWAAMRLKHHAGLPFVVTSHGDVNNPKRIRRPLVRRRMANVIEAADGVSHLSRALKRCADAIRASDGKDAVIPNGIDLRWWRSDEPPARRDWVVAAGRFVPYKGFSTLIDAIAGLTRRGLGAKLVLAGGGPDGEALRQQARRHSLALCDAVADLEKVPGGSVCLPGYLRGSEKRGLLRASRVFAFPSRPESPEAFPLVLLEALAAGSPVVASDLPVVREVIEPGQTGLLVNPGDAEAWADAIGQLLTDRAMQTAMAAEAAMAAEGYDWCGLAGRFVALYERALRRNR